MKLVVGFLLLVFVCHTTVCKAKKNPDCYSSDPRALKYRGSQSETWYGGYTCQNWMSQSPNKHSFTPTEYPDKGLGNHNYCRNPDGADTVWCFTTDGPTWEYCNIGCTIIDAYHRRF